MRLTGRGIGIALSLVLLINTVTFVAQEGEPVTVTGSQTVIEILESLVTVGELDVALDASITGTTDGLAAFCRGDTDVAAASRPISVEEEQACIANGIEFAEYLLGYDVLAIVTHPDLTFASCLSTVDLNTILAPSAQYSVTDWDQSGIAEAESLPLAVYLPQENTATFALLDQHVAGFGLRGDAIIIPTDVDILEAVSGTVGAIGVVRFNGSAGLAGVQVVELYNETLDGCFAPSSETADDRQYTYANRLLLYVNQASMTKMNLPDLLEYITGEDAGDVVVESGFAAPSAGNQALNQALFRGEEGPGRQFSKDLVAYQMPPNLFGELRIGGASGLAEYMQNVVGQFTVDYNGITPDLQLTGEAAGARRFCNNEIDILALTHDLSSDTLTTCEANNVTPITVDLGSKAVILLANAGDDYLACLSQDQIIVIWGSTPERDPVAQWRTVSTDFPDADILLIAPRTTGDDYTDLLLTPREGPAVPVRLDVAEANDDPLYRAAAVANAEGSMTYLNWQEYQTVLEQGQDGIQLVAVDARAGCVAPTEGNIRSGEYPFTLDFKLVVNQFALMDPNYQSLLWYVFSDENYALFEQADLIAPPFSQLPEIREGLQTLYTEARVSLTQPSPEATPEATPATSP